MLLRLLTTISKEYNGRIFVYLGKKDSGIQKGAKADFVIRARNESDPFMNLGQRLRVGKCNNDTHDDLIILSPMS